MRTTVDIDDDLMRKLNDRAHKAGTSFKETLNDVVSRGLGETPREAPITLPSHEMGRVIQPIDRAWEIAAALEAEEVRHELEKGD